MIIHITEENENQRLDRFLLKRFKGAKRSELYKHIRKKDVKVNGKRTQAEYFLQNGDVIDLFLKGDLQKKWETSEIFKSVQGEFLLLYENDDLLLAFKPAGELSMPDGSDRLSLQEKVQSYLKDYHTKTFVPSLLHRLDFNTAGILLFAKNYQSAKKYSKQIRQRKIRKKYLAFVHGKLEIDECVDVYLDKEENQKMVVSSSGKKSTTYMKTLASNQKVSLIECELITGRTHQIRASLAHLNHPIVGDLKYGGSGKGQQLLAYKIEIDEQVFSYVPKEFSQQIKEEFNESCIPSFTGSVKRIQL